MVLEHAAHRTPHLPATSSAMRKRRRFVFAVVLDIRDCSARASVVGRCCSHQRPNGAASSSSRHHGTRRRRTGRQTRRGRDCRLQPRRPPARRRAFHHRRPARRRLQAVGSQTEVWLDSGIRSGKICSKTGPWARAASSPAAPSRLGAYSDDGVRRALEIMMQQMDVTMAFTGHRNLSEVDKNILVEGTYPRRAADCLQTKRQMQTGRPKTRFSDGLSIQAPGTLGRS